MSMCTNDQWNLLVQGEHASPHTLLGVHDGSAYIYRPDLSECVLEGAPCEKVHPEGVFQCNRVNKKYQVSFPSGLKARDPYTFSPSVSHKDLELFNAGSDPRVYEKLGGRLCDHEGVKGARFLVWAPNALSVHLIADFNHWDDRLCPMRLLGDTGVFELFVPGLKEGEKYKFAVKFQSGHIEYKIDPYGLYAECRPDNASILFDVDRYEWKHSYQKREETHPVNVYEVHLESWKGEGFPRYRDIAHELSSYVVEMGYTHVELMPVMEHPLDESWGYQVTGFYAATSRYGDPSDLQYFIDVMHSKNIGVILDWVPAHFPNDPHALAHFDGTALYEHEDPKQGFHPHWNTHIFNYGRYEVSNFLLGSALFWCDKMRIDGIRVDAVASMLYLDYGRSAGEWIPNIYGGNENLEAIDFLKRLNQAVKEFYPHVVMIAEESSTFPGVTDRDGLGFDLKWNMGWMNDTLRYCSLPFAKRKEGYDILTHTFSYMLDEQFMLVLSHDEVVHGKKHLLNKMPGHEWERFAGVRLLISLMMCHPGKKLTFMGCEIGQWHEWSSKEESHFSLLDVEYNKGLHLFFKEINTLYINTQDLWGEAFVWALNDDAAGEVLAYIRGGLLCVHNLSNKTLTRHLPLPNECLQVVFDSDRCKYGGTGGLIVIEIDGGIELQLPPCATAIVRIYEKR